MSFENLRKLNAETNTMINNLKLEMDDMKTRQYENYRKMYDQMVVDLKEMSDVASEICDYERDLWVETEICSHLGHPVDNYKLRFERGNHIGVGSGACYLGRFDIDYGYAHEKKKNDQELRSPFTSLNFKLDEIILGWEEQRGIFKRRFEEECVRLIKSKAEKANANYDFAKQQLEKSQKHNYDHLITLDDIGDIIEMFEDFLKEREVRIPTSDKSMIDDGGYTKETLHENSARIYGMDYADLQGSLLDYLEKLERKGKVVGVVNSWYGEVETWV